MAIMERQLGALHAHMTPRRSVHRTLVLGCVAGELRRMGSRIVVQLTDAPASSGCMPSVDTMLWSVSEIYGRSGIGVVFSGMGRDGLVGSARIVDRGGAVLVQNQQSSAVWGMPRAVAEAGLASAVLAPAELAVRVASRAESSSWR